MAWSWDASTGETLDEFRPPFLAIESATQASQSGNLGVPMGIVSCNSCLLCWLFLMHLRVPVLVPWFIPIMVGYSIIFAHSAAGICWIYVQCLPAAPHLWFSTFRWDTFQPFPTSSVPRQLLMRKYDVCRRDHVLWRDPQGWPYVALCSGTTVVL